MTRFIGPAVTGADIAPRSVSVGSPYTSKFPAGTTNPLTAGTAGAIYDEGGYAVNLCGPKYRALGTWDPIAGTGDISTAYAQCVTDLQAVGGGLIHAPAATLNTGATLETPPLVSLEGSGWATLFQSSTASPILRMDGVSGGNEGGVHAANLRIDGGAVANALTGLMIVKWTGVPGSQTVRAAFISSIQITRCGTGLRCVNTQGFSAYSCKFGGNGGDGLGNGTGVYISDNSEIGVFQQCDFRGNTVVGLLLENSGAIIGAGSIGGIYSWKFDTCHFEKNTGQATILDGASNNTFLNCKWEQNTGDYITLQTVNGTGRPDQNVFRGAQVNGNASNPNYINAITCSGTVFDTCRFNNNGGQIVIGAGAFHTSFPNSTVACPLTDNSTAGTGTSWDSAYANRVARERPVNTLVDAAPIAWDATLAEIHVLTFTNAVGNARTLSAPTNKLVGQWVTLILIQDATGGRNLTPFTVRGSTFANLGTLANAIAIWTIFYDGANWNQVSFVPYSNAVKVASLTSASVGKTANYTITMADHTIWADATAGIFTVTLPNATFFNGVEFVIKKIDVSANAVTVAGGGTNIDGAANYALAAQYKYVKVQSNGTQWFVVANN